MRENKSWFHLSKRQLLVGGGAFLVFGSSTDKPLSPRQKAIILGNILGDGHLQVSPNGKTTRLRYTHSMKQAAYVERQYRELDWLSKGVSKPTETTEKQKYKLCRAYTAYRPELTHYHTLTYRKSTLPGRKFIKTIPENFGEYLTQPEALMVWYLDDGTLRRPGGTCRLATQNFTLQEHEILQDCLKKNFQIDSVIEKWPDDKTGLYVSSRNENAARFVSLFADVIKKEIPSMNYKIEGFI